jgi:hypothetical protein
MTGIAGASLLSVSLRLLFRPEPLLSPEACLQLTNDPFATPPTKWHVDLRAAVQAYRGNSGFGNADCICCGRQFDFRTRTVVDVVAERSLIVHMLQRLKPRPGFPSTLAAQYNVGARIPLLEGLLLSTFGIVTEATSTQPARVTLCQECKTSLERKAGALPPKFAIANGLAFGTLPEALSDASFASKRLVALASLRQMSYVVDKGPYRAATDHCLVFDATPSLAQRKLPHLLEGEEFFRVVFAGGPDRRCF